MISKKHILFLSSWYPSPQKPFLGNFIKAQAEILSQKYKITVLHTIDTENIDDLKVEVKETDNLKEVLVFFPQGSNFISRKRNRVKAFQHGLNSIQQPDIILAHVILPNIYLFSIAKNHFKCPLVVTEHSSVYNKDLKQFSLKDKFLLRFAKSKIDKLIAVSEFLKSDLALKFPTLHIDVVHNPVDLTLFKINQKKASRFSYFLHISTLDKKTKNVEGILEAVSFLVQKGYEQVRLKIVSDELSNEWFEKVASLGLNRYVELIGPKQAAELIAYYQEASAFVLFSEYETFSLVLAESWSCGTPTISTSVGIANQLNPKLGIQVKKGDALHLAMAMEKIINGATFDNQFIHDYAQQFSIENYLSKMEEIVESCLKANLD